MKSLILFLILITNSFASTEYRKIWKDLYDPTDKIRDIVFDLEAQEIEDLVKNKMVTHEVEDFKLRYYWINDNMDMEVINKASLPAETIKTIKDEFLSKIELVVGSDFKKFVEGYEYVGIKHGWYSWLDPTGLKDINTFKMKRSKKTIEIIQKKATGTIKSKYFLKKTKWSNSKWILWKVTKNIFEGVQNIKIEGRLTHQEKNGLWLPKKFALKTEHILNQNDTENYTRTIEIDYLFNNYKVNTSEALRWFSTR